MLQAETTKAQLELHSEPSFLSRGSQTIKRRPCVSSTWAPLVDSHAPAPEAIDRAGRAGSPRKGCLVVLTLQQHDVMYRPGCYQDGRFVVVEWVSVVWDNDDCHVDHLLSLLFIAWREKPTKTGKEILQLVCLFVC